MADEALLLSERGMFYLERLPRLLTLQTELVIDQATASPELGRLLTDADRFAAVGGRFARVAENLPRQLSEERQSALAQASKWLDIERQRLLKDLESQEASLRGVLGDIGQLMASADPLTDKLTSAVQSFTVLYRLIDSSPSNLRQYNDLVGKSLIALEKIEHLLEEPKTFLDAKPDHTSEHIDSLLQTLQTDARLLIDQIFWLGVFLVSLFLCGLFMVLVLYRY